MLSVRIDSDYVRGAAEVRKARLKRGALAPVPVVNENRVYERNGLFEDILPRRGAVIDEDDMPKALLQPRKEREQLAVWIVGRNQNRGPAVYGVVPHFPSLTAFSRAMRRM